MTWPELAIFTFAAASSVGAIAVVLSRNVVHAALYLVVALGGVGVVFILLGAEFLGWAQFLIYVGAIVVLLLFGLMLTRAPIGSDTTDTQQRPLALLGAGAVFGVLTWLIWSAFGDERIPLERVSRASDVGNELFTRAVLPFELISVMLLAALIGAIVLTKRD